MKTVREHIEDIEKFRLAHKGKCVSTSHDLSIPDFNFLLAELIERYGNFTADFTPDNVKVTIPFY